jgi:asparagine synthase (glutamine-hydrolysing)
MWPAMVAAAHAGAGGLPLRVLFPYFDLRLVEYVWSVPAFPWRSGKQLLREAMRGRLPETVRLRPKTPFFDLRTSEATAHPDHRLALRAEVRRQRRRLLEAPGLEEYVEMSAARTLVDAPEPPRAGPRFETVFELAGWLRARG